MISHFYHLKFEQSENIIRYILDDRRIEQQIKSLESNTSLLEHSVRVVLLSVDLGVENSFSEQEIKLLGYSGLFHDIGKLLIPEQVLNKESSLNSAERKVIEEHVRIGTTKLNGLDDVVKIIACHHEYQTNPYPRTGACRRKFRQNSNERREDNSSIINLAQIVSVADIYDALRNPRSYKPSIDNLSAKAIMLKQYKGNYKYIHQIISR